MNKQPAPVGDCHIAGKAVVPEEFNQLEAVAKRLQEALVSASIECAGKQQEALSKAMEAYLEVSTPSVMLSLLQQNAELKAERDALAAELNKQPAPVVKVPDSISVRTAIKDLEQADMVTTIAQAYKMAWNSCRAEVLRLNNQG